MSNTFDKQSVLESFIEEVNSYLPEIETNLERLTHVPGDMDALEETYRRAHTIGGSASMMDFPGLAHVAHGMEDILGDVLDGFISLNEGTLETLCRSLGRLKRLLGGVRGGIDEEPIIAEDDADYARYRATIDGATQPSQSMQRVAPTPYESPAQIQQPLQQAQLPQAPYTQEPQYVQEQQQPYAQEPMQEPQYVQEQQQPYAQEPLYVPEPVRSQPLELPSPPPTTPYYFEEVEPAAPVTKSSSLPSLEEVLNSFRTPSVMPGDDLDWPEDPPAGSRADEPGASYWSSTRMEEPPKGEDYWSSQAFQPPPVQPSRPWASSALDELMASTRSSSVPLPASPQPKARDYADTSAGDLYSPPSIAPEVGPSYAFAQQQSVTPVEPVFPAPAPVEPEVTPQVEAYRAWNSLGVMPPLPTQDVQPFPSGPVQDARFYQTIPAQDPQFFQSDAAEIVERVADSEPDALLVAYQEAQQGTTTLESQVASLRNVADQLRSAMSVIEVQRSEFKGFLDGSKDALDRMEEWAGRAMGLNLRNSPEQVRRYLPLSVMWVANSKLKKVLDLLRQITSGVELSDEQFTAILQQLRDSLNACGDAFRQVQGQPSHVLRQEPGWSAWEMRHNVEELRERVTFERQGDPDAMRVQIRAELEEQLRAEISQEYAAKPISLAARAEIEQQIRSEVRQEFETRHRLQESVGPEHEDILKELEARLRNDIEIQVRQEFLSQLNNVGSDVALALQKAPPTDPGSATDLTLSTPSTPVVKQVRPAPLPPPEVPLPSSFGDFGEEAAEIFRTEAEEHLQTISMHVAALEKDQTNRDLIQGIRRATHTLKGAAGMMGFRAIADLCHVSEDLLDSVMEGTTPITSAVLSLILDTAEALDVLISGKNTDGLSEETRVQTLRVRHIDLLGEDSVASIAVEDELEVVAEHLNAVSFSGVLSEGKQENGLQHPRTDLTVHVRLSRLDELVNLFGELLVNRSVLEARLARLARLISDVAVSSNRLNDVGQKLESRFEAASLPSGRTVSYITPDSGQHHITGNSMVDKPYLAEFDELELDRYTEFHQLTRSLSECISDMTTLSTEMDSTIRECEGIFSRESRLSTTFQDRLMKARLVPLSALTPRLYRAARAVAFKQNKDINFVTEGDTTEVDRTVFEEISGPLLHLIRNAVNHAVETPELRAQKGKPAAGQIKLSASYEGNQIVITVSDDGTGIDRDGVRNTAITRGLIRPNQQLSESDVIELIFHPGFSTAEVLSEESGRGVGLDVVRDSVSRLRGKIVVESTPSQGTAFTMTFPTSLAIQNAMMVRVGGQQFAIPTVAVESIGRLDNFKRASSGGQPAVIIQSEIYPLQLLSHYLALPDSVMEEKAQLIFINSGGQRVALVVDEISGRSDIVMKNLGPHLRQVHGMAGGTVLGNGRVVLVLELNDLLASRPRGIMPLPPVAPSGVPVQQRTSAQSRSQQSTSGIRPVGSAKSIPESGKHILIVDDSPSVRRVVSSTLKQHGWEVQTARDGAEALEMISYETPAAVLLDIEMPRMDGYELISTVRAQEQYRSLPLVVLTSRAAAKHQQRAMLLGASAYVVKPYQDEELINILNSLVYGAAVR